MSEVDEVIKKFEAFVRETLTPAISRLENFSHIAGHHEETKEQIMSVVEILEGFKKTELTLLKEATQAEFKAHMKSFSKIEKDVEALEDELLHEKFQSARKDCEKLLEDLMEDLSA